MNTKAQGRWHFVGGYSSFPSYSIRHFKDANWIASEKKLLCAAWGVEIKYERPEGCLHLESPLNLPFAGPFLIKLILIGVWVSEAQWSILDQILRFPVCVSHE